MATSQPPEDNRPHPADMADRPQAQTQSKSMALAAPGAGSAIIAAGETSSSAIAAREKAAVEARFLVAMHRPREFDTCRLRLLKACDRPRFAEVARYSKPVGREKVTGLSIRFAEEARVLWGNMDVTTMVVSDTDDRRIYRVTGVDLETNATDSIDVIVEKFVERRQVKEGAEVIGQRMNTTGQIVYRIRATEDDMTVKANAQISKAKRNVILSLLPGDVKEECEEAIVATQKNRDAEDPDAAKRRVLAAFFDLGVMPGQIADLLGHAVEGITPAELQILRGFYTALKDGEATWAEIFDAHTNGKKPAGDAAAAKVENKPGTEGLKARVAKKPDATATTKDSAEDGKCEFCQELVGKGAPHRPDCPSLK